MRRTLFLLIVFVLSSSVTATAQQWSPEQQEVIDHIKGCWDAWATKSFDNFMDTCAPSENHLWWYTDNSLPHDMDFTRTATEAEWRTKDVEYLWNEPRPLAIQIHGDVALVHLYALFSWTEDGEVISVEQKRFEAFRKVGGQWTPIGGMAVPSNDSD